jgi:hypothetical protein
MAFSYSSEERIKPLPQKEFDGLLDQEAKQKGHTRQQRLMDAVTTVACFSIYVVPSVLALLYVGVLANKAISGDWDTLEDSLKAMLIPVSTYIVGVLSKNILKN